MDKNHVKIFFMVALSILVFSTIVWGNVIDLPKTGQTDCYNNEGKVIPCAGTGQDGDLRNGVAWPNPRFQVKGECVTDKLTGLMWTRSGNLTEGPKKWQDSLNYVAEMNRKGGICGYTDWRLPNVIELGSLLNKQEANSAAWLNKQGFTNAQEYEYWTSTTRANLKEHAWRIQMTYGHQTGNSKSVNGYVWPVRSAQSSKDKK